MLKAMLLLWLSFLIVTLEAKSAPFIDPCKWNDKECLKLSSQKAIPFLADGIPELGTSPVDPMHIKTVTVDEGGLNIVFNNVHITGLRHCQIADIERNVEEHWISLVLECPIDIKGQYVASGKLVLLPVQGDGPFHMLTDKIVISMKMDLMKNTDGNHWQLGNYTHSFEVKEKALMKFENLFNGDEKKAAPVQQILDNQWKELLQSLGKTVVAEAVHNVILEIQKLIAKVPANELEL